MAATSTLCDSFKTDILQGLHLATHGYKMSLYSSAQAWSTEALRQAATAYSATNEISGTGYTATGLALTKGAAGLEGGGGAGSTGAQIALTGHVASMDWANAVWADATFTARYGLIYNDSLVGKNAVAVVDFGADQTCSAASFTVTLPDTGVGAVRLS